MISDNKLTKFSFNISELSPAEFGISETDFEILLQKLQPFLEAVSAIPSRQKIISIDGRCGSGKTTIAAILQKLTDGFTVHMDDYYLPFSDRQPDWQNIPGGNMNFERLQREVLIPFRNNGSFLYRAYRCRENTYLPTVNVKTDLLIVEGSYCLHPHLGTYTDLSAFITASADIQKSRLIFREGSHYTAFESMWIPAEERYYKAFNVQKRAALMIDTGK